VWLLLVWDVKWTVRVLECDVVTGMWRGDTTQEMYWRVMLLLGCGGDTTQEMYV
jgi:hypothetical protein